MELSRAVSGKTTNVWMVIRKTKENLRIKNIPKTPHEKLVAIQHNLKTHKESREVRTN